MKSTLLGSLLVLSLATPAFATPIDGVSWDGCPPCNLSQLTGVNDFQIGLPTFQPGDWVITFDNGYTAWRNLTTIYWVDDSSLNVLLPPGPFANGTSVAFTTSKPWALTVKTPSLTDPEAAEARSDTGDQWAWYGNGSCGLEDIRKKDGDADYQDLRCALQNTSVPPIVTPFIPIIPEIPQTPVPESPTLILVATGAFAFTLRRLLYS